MTPQPSAASLSPIAVRTRSRRDIIGLTAFVCILGALVVLGTICIIHAIQWIDKPFAGFLLFGYRGVGSFADLQWPAFQTGIHYRDLILAVDGRPVMSSRDILEALSRFLPGDTVTYQLLNRQGQVLDLSVPVSLFLLKDFLKIVLPVLVVSLLFWGMAVVVYALKPNTLVTWIFVIFCAVSGIYMVTGFEMQAGNGSLWSYHLNMFGIAFFPALCTHLSWLFPERSGLLRRWPIAPVFLYLVSGALLGFHVWSVAAVMRPGLSTDAYAASSSDLINSVNYIRIFALLSTLSMVGFSAYAFFYSPSVIGRRRALVVLLGFALAFLPISGGMILMTVFTKLFITQNLFAFSVVLFPIAIGYAITHHNLFDVDTYIKRTVGYVLMTSIVAGAYFAFERVFKTIVLDPLLGDSSGQVYPFLFALLTVFAFNPVSQKVQQGVDKLFFRKGADFKMAVAGVSESLTSMVDVQAFIETIIHTVRTDLFIDRAGVVVVDARTNTCRSTFHGGKFGRDTAPLEEVTDPGLSPDDPLLALLAREKKLITKYDVAEDPRYSAVRELCGQRFEELGASLVLPLFYHDQFSGALTLGYKKSGHFYTREDIDLLKTLSAMTSTAIEQSREKGQKAVLMQLFSKHVSPQVAESLWEQREQFLEGGRPKSQSMVVTAMFTDLQGFSTISEKQTPEVLMNWLNIYLDMMTTTVMEHGGVVDDFFGDGVKINFGVPIPRETEQAIRQDAVNAVNCALAMEQKMIVLNGQMAAQGQQPLRMRVGIYTGPVVAGSLGSANRMKYTTIGDTVNTAARLESFDKDLVIARVTDSPCRILIGEPTLRHVESMFDVEKVGELSLKGKSEKVGAFCVVGRMNEPALVQEAKA